MQFISSCHPVSVDKFHYIISNSLDDMLLTVYQIHGWMHTYHYLNHLLAGVLVWISTSRGIFLGTHCIKSGPLTSFVYSYYCCSDVFIIKKSWLKMVTDYYQFQILTLLFSLPYWLLHVELCGLPSIIIVRKFKAYCRDYVNAIHGYDTYSLIICLASSQNDL